MSHSAEKTAKGGPFGLPSTFGSIKNLWFSARLEPTLSCFSDLRKSGLTSRPRSWTNEQKKYRSRWTDEKKTSRWKSRAFSSKTPTKNEKVLKLLNRCLIKKYTLFLRTSFQYFCASFLTLIGRSFKKKLDVPHKMDRRICFEYWSV